MKFLFSPSFILCLYVISIFTPIIYSYYLIIPFALALLFFFLTIRKFFRLKNTLLFTLFTFILIALFYRFTGISTADLGNYANYIFILITVWGGMYLWNYSSERYRKIVFYTFLITFIINVIYSIQIRILIPDLDVVMKKSESSINMYGMLNIGSTEYTYSAMFTALFCYISLFRVHYYKKNISTFFIILLFIFSTFYLVVYGQSATALFSFLGAISCLIIFNKGKRWLSAIFLLSVLVIILLSVIYDKEVVSLITNIAGEKIATRVAAIIHITSGSADEDDEGLLGRFPMIWFDIKMWLSELKSFVFGWGYHTYDVGVNQVYEAMIKNKCGDHSAIFDALPRYGILGLATVYYVLLSYKKYLSKTLSVLSKEIWMVILVVVVLNNVMNKTLQHNVLFILFFLYPYLSYNVKPFLKQSNRND